MNIGRCFFEMKQHCHPMQRYVYCQRATKAELENFAKVALGHVLFSPNKVVGVNSIGKFLKEFAQAAGIEDWNKKTPHTVRQYFITKLANAPDVNPHEVAKKARHKSVNSQKAYVRPTDSSRIAVTNALQRPGTFQGSESLLGVSNFGTRAAMGPTYAVPNNGFAMPMSVQQQLQLQMLLAQSQAHQAQQFVLPQMNLQHFTTYPQQHQQPFTTYPQQQQFAMYPQQQQQQQQFATHPQQQQQIAAHNVPMTAMPQHDVPIAPMPSLPNAQYVTANLGSAKDDKEDQFQV